MLISQWSYAFVFISIGLFLASGEQGRGAVASLLETLNKRLRLVLSHVKIQAKNAGEK